LVVRETIPVSELGRLRPWLEWLAGERPLVVAAGGDGTVGAVADAVAHSDAALGIVPLGTSNDVARSLDIPLDIEAAVRLLATGPISTVDLGRFEAPDAAPRHFVHAAALGLNVAFARVATRVSVRKRLGRLTYMVAASALIRRREAFRCVLSLDDGDRSLSLSLVHLSVINAPVFGGFFGLRLRGSDRTTVAWTCWPSRTCHSPASRWPRCSSSCDGSRAWAGCASIIRAGWASTSNSRWT
jgi:hypothetical protein